MMKAPQVVIVLALALSLVAVSNAAVFEGDVDNKVGLVYLGKFCYGYDGTAGGAVGKWTATITTSTPGVTFGTHCCCANGTRYPV
mgnify:CR=1 FL=1